MYKNPKKQFELNHIGLTFKNKGKEIIVISEKVKQDKNYNEPIKF